MRILFALALLAITQSVATSQEKSPLTLLVMDPLAAELSCPCVKGYAQRDYALLGKHLEKQLGRPVKVHFSESITAAMKKKVQADVIIGKESIIRNESKSLGLKATPLLALTGKDGKTTMTGLIVVPSLETALAVSDLKGYRILFGPSDADEKHSAALALLKDFEVPVAKVTDTCNSCSEGALKILEMQKEGVKAAAVISSYAQPLLEGCGTVKKGELRVVGATDPVPFIVAFVSDRLNSGDRGAVEKALLSVSGNAGLCTALETKSGFVSLSAKKK